MKSAAAVAGDSLGAAPAAGTDSLLKLPTASKSASVFKRSAVELAGGAAGRARSTLQAPSSRTMSAFAGSGERSKSVMKFGGGSGRGTDAFRPVSLDDLTMALSVITADSSSSSGGGGGGGGGAGKRITQRDLHAFYARYFPVAEMPAKLAKYLVGSQAKEDTITREQLQSLLIGKQYDYFQDSFQLVEHDEKAEVISEESLKRLVRRMDTKYGMMRRGDLAALRDRFDRDRDGAIGRDDWKKMGVSMHRHTGK
ncbi:hypothetical protein HDU84_007309 [Entophlyctis sp. JEL0112]|nr:hypothetical protein HDU84_007309 [Entophlyctis sp. JEL0112]